MTRVQYRKRHRRYHHDYIDARALEKLIEKKLDGSATCPSKDGSVSILILFEAWVEAILGPIDESVA